MRAAPYSVAYFVPLSVIVGWYFGGWFTFLTPVLVFGLVPLLDLVFGYNKENATEEEEKELKEKKSFRILTWIGMPVTGGLLIWGLYIISTKPLTLVEFIGFTLSMGLSSGIIGINISHELQHRVNNKFEPTLARFMLLSTLYMHWAIEHVTGHHRWVATPEDPATARLGQSYYSFWPQSVFKGFISAWKFENNRIKKQGKNFTLLRNRIFHYIVYELLFVILIYFIFSLTALFFFIIQSLIAISLLEIINYIEHYGLLRKKQENGKYERPKPVHSWNSSKRLTNWYLFNLQRHSDHHYRPGRRYQILRHFEESPQLPTGYAGMVLLALIPPLFKRVMNHRIPPEQKKLARR
jgi:alkane 1-monooxygenase